jgi:hypothetical protein
MDVAVLKAFVHMDDRGFLEGLTAETFWEFLRPLLKGKVHSGKDRVRQLITDMTGNPDGGLTPFLKEPAKLQNQHDLPRYLLYMKAKCGDMEEVVPTPTDGSVGRSKMDAADSLKAVVTHVSRLLPKLLTQFVQTKASAKGPFTIAIIEAEVSSLESGGMVDQSLGTMAMYGGVDRRTKHHQTRAVWRGPSSMFAAGGGTSGALVSGLNYGNLPDGMNFDQQRNMGWSNTNPNFSGAWNMGWVSIGGVQTSGFDTSLSCRVFAFSIQELFWVCAVVRCG